MKKMTQNNMIYGSAIMQTQNSDLLTLITNKLPITTLALFLQSNKQIYLDRHRIICMNENIILFEKHTNMLYTYTIRNSHIVLDDTEDNMQIRLCDKMDTDKRKTYNTFKMFSYAIEKKSSIPIINTALKEYIQYLIQLKYNDKIDNIYINMLCRQRWWDINVYLIDLFDIIHSIKKRQYRQVYDILNNIEFHSNKYNIFATMQFLMNFTELLRSKATKICFIHIIYAVIDDCMHELIHMEKKKLLFKTIIEKSFEFSEQIAHVKMIPRYLKTHIVNQIVKTRALLIDMTHT